MICFVCEYGFVERWNIVPLNQEILMCNSCEAIWFNKDEVVNQIILYENKESEIILRLSIHLKKHNLTQIPKNLEHLGDIG